MAGGSLFVWIPFLLSCVFQVSDNRHVRRGMHDSIDDIKNPETDHISRIPITLPEGIDPKNINVTSITIKTCTDMTEQLAQLNIRLQQTNLRNSHLDNEAFGLRREVRQLNLQLATCSATASAITGSYQTQLLNKMKQLLETFDSDTFLILKIIALTREVNTLQKKIKHAANATETSEIEVLQREQQEKINELNMKTQQMEISHPNSALILQIISLQNQIWDKERAQSRRGEINRQLDNNILALQGQLDRKISELRAKEDADSAMLELISVHSKITVMQRLITVHIERSRASAADYQRQWKQKADLLRRKIVLLNRDESNTELTKEILILQTEVEHFRQLMINAKKTTESQIKELRVILEEEKKQQANLQKHLEETDYTQSQVIMKFISVMKEVRELDDDEQHHTTSTSQATTLQTLLQAKEKEFAKAQAEINELQRKLQLKSKECSGLEERYEAVKTEIEQKIVELNRTRNSKAALILNVINLHGDLKTLRDLISAASDPDRISELQRQLEEKQEELNSKTADMERLIPNPKIILKIIELQNNIWDLQKKAANESTGDDVKDLQDRVKGLISELDDNGDDNTKLMLTIITLQSQVEQLQRQLPTTLVTQLTDDLKNELQKYVNELNEKNPTTARLILTITDLQNQLRNLEKGEHNKDQTASAAITKLREQLKAKVEERIRDQVEIKALQNKLNQTEAQCTGFEHKLKDLQTNLDAKMKELLSKSESVSSLALQISTLTLQLEELKRQLQNTKSETKIKELQKLIDEKNDELARKTEELKASSAQPQRLLQIIAIQTQIEKLSYVAANDTDYEKIRALQDHLNYLVDGIQDENNENTKLMFKILAHQDEIARLEKQEKRQTQAALDRIKDLENELEDIRNQIEEKRLLLNSSDTRIANLTAQIMELHKKIKPLEEEILDIRDTSAENVRELQKRLELITRQLQDSELRLQEADAKNFDLIMEIADLRTQLKKAQKKASKPAENSNELEQQLQTQQRMNIKLESANKDLQRQLQQSQEDADRLQQQLSEKDANLKQLQQQLEEQIRENNRLQNEKNQLEDIVQDLENRLSNVEDKTIYAKLREQLKAKVEERIRDQAEIKALQNKLNQTEAQCTGFEHKLKDLQTNLDAKMKELQSKSESVSSLALQISTLTLQLEELKRQLQNTKSETKIKELQKLIDEKNNELARKTEELKASSAQPQRLLQIIAIQTQIEKLSYVAANDTDYEKIRALQDHLNNLVDEIQDENNENTKLMFKILAHQDEIARLERQEKRQTQAALDRIKDLENELEDIRNQIEEKTLLLNSSDSRISTLTAQIMELHKKIKPLEDKILDIRNISAENVRELQKRLELITRQLQDSELRLQEADAKNFDLIMEIADLRTQLKKAQKKASKPAENSNELEQQLQTQQRVNKRLESANKELTEQLKAKMEERIRDQAEIKALHNKLNQTEAQCTGFEHKLKDLQTNLDAKMKELQSKSESVSSLALQISTLTLQLEELKRQLQNTKSETKIKELQKLIDEKNNELARKTEELKASSAQPQRLLQIIAIQTQIEKLSYVAANDTDYEKIRALQDHLNNLVDEIQDENNENTKLMFKILAHQDEIARLEKQEKRQTQAALDRIKDLENELEDIRNQIEEKTLLLNSSDSRISTLTAQIMELHKKIKPLEEEILDIRDTSAENVRELQKRLELITRQLQDSELRLQEADAKNFDLIMEIADLRTQLKKAQKKASKPAENSNELEQQLQTQQRVNKRLESANKDLKEEVKELKMRCTDDVAYCADLQRQLQQSQEDADRLQQQLSEKDANLKQQLEEQIRENNRLQSEKNQLEDNVQDLQNRLSNVEDKTIYARQVTLDPNTAHPRIALSADNTRISTTAEAQNVPDNPGRFDVVLAVLGTTGYSTGRHYWEVSVAGKLCYHLGMASESAPRKGTMKFSPANGYWTLVMNKQGQLRAIDRKPFNIPIQTQPLTLGILLDYKKGQISFYDAGVRSHMYSFVGQRFTDKIYPFVNFCVEDLEGLTPIELLSPGLVDWLN